MQFNDFGILITAYENVEQSLQNILHIRKNFNSINKCQIVVISTTEKPEVRQQFTNLLYREGLQPLIVKVLDNVPGNPGVCWQPPEQVYNSWRHKWLPIRIFKSLSAGFNLLYEVGIEVGLHLHSDTFLKSEYEERLLDEITDIQKDCLGYWDLCIEDHTGVHVHPEGMAWFLPKCKELGILDIPNCFYQKHYRHWNWASTESLIGTWCNYRLCAQNIGIDERGCQNFYNEFKVRTKRPYHGDFEHIINLGGVQPDASN